MRLSLFLVLLVVTITVSCVNVVSAKQAVVIKPLAQVHWQDALPKVKAVSGKLRGEAKAITAAAETAVLKNGDEIVTKLQAGGKLKSLDTSKKQWQSAFVKLKQTGQLKGATESQVAKITESVAQELVKKPSKWRYFVKLLKITFVASVVALILLGVNAMIS